MLAVGALAALILCATPALAHAGTYYVYSCSSYGNAAPAFTPLTGGVNWNLANECNVGRSLEINQFSRVLDGKTSAWVARSPSAAIAIVGAYTPVNAVYVDCTLASDGFSAAYRWAAGSERITYINGCGSEGLGYANGISLGFAPSSSFGWSVTCTRSGGCISSAVGHRILGVQGVRLTAEENTGPYLDAVPASNIWYRNGWVRGSWPMTLDASDPSGVCALAVVVDGTALAKWVDSAPDASRFEQCHGSQLPGELDTAGYDNGEHTLTYGASNAAGVVSAPSKTIWVDNAPVSLSLSGPTDAPSTAGTQYVQASASAGPSGVGAIVCSVDGSPSERYGGATAHVAVSGVGPHRVACYAQNNAVDASGVPAVSPMQTWYLAIRRPTTVATSFASVVDALRCRRVTERLQGRLRWVTARRGPRLVRVRRRGVGRTMLVTRCHPRTVWRRELVWRVIRRNGKLMRVEVVRLIRVVVLPHVVNRPARRVRFGRGATVSGWLGLTDGAALAGQLVRVLTAPDNGLRQFHQAAVTVTRADGSFSVRLRPGPSRLVVAVYAGSATTEPALSPPIRLIVPAKVRLRITPTHTRWGATITIAGRVLGGYIPAGKFLRLRIGVGQIRETVGIPEVAPDGRFRTTWTFASGTGTVRYWFSVSTLPEADYPYAPASSPRVSVTVGPG